MMESLRVRVRIGADARAATWVSRVDYLVAVAAAGAGAAAAVAAAGAGAAAAVAAAGAVVSFITVPLAADGIVR